MKKARRPLRLRARRVAQRLSLIASVVAAAPQAPAAAQTLRDTVEQAVQTNPEVLASASRRQATEQDLRAARGAYLPRVDLTLGLGRQQFDTPTSRAFGLSGQDFTSRTRALTVSQMLFDGYAVRSEVARQLALVASTANRVAFTAEDIGLRTALAYLELLRRQDNVRAAEENLSEHQRLHELIRLRTESGVGRRADFEQAEGRLALAQSNLQIELSALRDARSALARLAGVAPEDAARPPAPLPVLDAPAALRETALAHNPAVRVARAEIEAAQAGQQGAQAALAPRVDLELAAVDDRNRVIQRSADYNAFLRLRYNLFRGGSDLARIRSAGFRIEEARAQLEQTQREVEENLEVAANALRTAAERTPTLQRYVEAAGATRRAYAGQFGIGQRTLLDLLNAQNEYFNAQLALAASDYTELGAQYRVLAATGRLLDTLRVAPPAQANAEFVPGAR